MNNKYRSCATKISILSITLNIVVILLSQLSIAFKYSIWSPPICENEQLSESNLSPSGQKDIKCPHIFEFDVNSMDTIFVVITLLSIFLDLPANVMLFVAIRLKISWMFLPWLVVTKLKIIGSIFISCMLMHYVVDISRNNHHDLNITSCFVNNYAKIR